MMRAVRWPFWAGLAAFAVAWAVAGFALPVSTDGNLLFAVASVAAFFASFGFVLTYTVAGLRGPAKWWRNDVGTFLVLAVAAQLAVVGVPAFAVMFHHGMINTRWWAWAWIGGVFMSAVMVAGLSWLYLRSVLSRR